MTVDFFYPFHFDRDIDKAVKRLQASIESVIKQDVRICVCNTSAYCIARYLEKLGKINYIHRTLSVPVYCKPLTINFGVRSLVESEYFFTSDIDLIYQPHHVEIMLDHSTDVDKPVRVINYNHNISYECYSSNYEDHMKKPRQKDPAGRPWGGFAHGNGLIHLKTFHKIRGYDEEFVGYGPEDDMFNQRIGKLNQLIYTKFKGTTTAHIPHPSGGKTPKSGVNHTIYHKKINALKKIEAEKSTFTLEDVMGNKDSKDWGVIL